MTYQNQTGSRRFDWRCDSRKALAVVIITTGANHWIDDHIATPMSKYRDYEQSRQSFGINVLGTLIVEVEAKTARPDSPFRQPVKWAVLLSKNTLTVSLRVNVSVISN